MTSSGTTSTAAIQYYVGFWVTTTTQDEYGDIIESYVTMPVTLTTTTSTSYVDTAYSLYTTSTCGDADNPIGAYIAHYEVKAMQRRSGAVGATRFVSNDGASRALEASSRAEALRGDAGQELFRLRVHEYIELVVWLGARARDDRGLAAGLQRGTSTQLARGGYSRLSALRARARDPHPRKRRPPRSPIRAHARTCAHDQLRRHESHEHRKTPRKTRRACRRYA